MAHTLGQTTNLDGNARGEAHMSRVSHRRSARVVYTALGFVSLAVAVVGVVVPGIPTTGPVLLAAFFFSKGSARFHRWLLNNKRFGPAIRDYQAGLGIPMRAKVTAIVMIVLTFGITIALTVTRLWVGVLLVLLAGAISWYILSRPTKPKGVTAETLA